MPHTRILIVEDEHIAARGIRQIVRNLGHEVVGLATSGKDALAQASATQPDLVLMDIELHGDLDGIETAEQIRTRFDIPVVYLTAHADEPRLQRAKTTEPFGYLVKPFGPRDLQTAIEMARYKYEMEQKLRQSEAKFRAISAAAPEAILVADEHSSIVFWNTAAETMFGYSAEEIVGQPLHQLLASEEDCAVYRTQIAHLQPSGQDTANTTVFELTAVKKDGTEFVAEMSASMINLHDSRNVVGIVRDITEQKQTSASLDEERHLLRTLIENSPDFIYVKDTEGRFRIVNQAIVRAFGASDPSELIGKTDFDFHPPELARQYQTDERAVLTSGQPMINHEEPVVEQTTGRQKWLLSTKVPFCDQQGNIVGLVGVIRDITAQKAASQSLEQLNQDLRNANRHKSNFLASMSHELRTPLNAMIGYTSLTLNALKTTLPPEHVQNLTRAEQSARVLLQLINDVLDFSKIEAGRMELFIEEIDLVDLLEDVMITAEGLMAEKPYELREEIPDELPMVESDYTRLKQILDNLIGNAIKFTSEGYVLVRATADEQTDGVRIEVNDTGCGIEPEFLGNIFDLFRQADGSITKQFKGTGLGLAITKRLSDMLGIHIGVESEVNSGTTFWLDVPLSQTSAHRARPESRPAETAETDEQPPKALVLCCGEADLCLTLEQQLNGFPLEVRPMQAVAECLKHETQELIWTIVLPPDARGFEMLAALKREPTLRPIPVVMTAVNTASQGFHLGRVEHELRPFRNEHLLDTLLRITSVPRGPVLILDQDPERRRRYHHFLAEAGYTPQVADTAADALDLLENRQLFRAILLDLLTPDMSGFQLLQQMQSHHVWQRIPVVVVTDRELTESKKVLMSRGTHLLLNTSADAGGETFPHQGEAIRQSVLLAGTRSILVIDDNEMNLNLMTGVFESAGYLVYQAKSGSEGIELAQTMRPATILMDAAMPGMDGFETTQRLKQNAATADITVIACSAFTAPEYRERAIQVGCEGYIAKPIEPKRLVEQVTKFVLASKIRRRARGNSVGESPEKQSTTRVSS